MVGANRAVLEKAAPVDDSVVPSTYSMRVGARLLAIRKQRGLSRSGVERASGGEFKASVVCAYERGERALSVPRLQRLAAFYHVPVDPLLPPDGEALPERPAPTRPEHFRIDLTRLPLLTGEEGSLLARFVRQRQAERGDYNGRLLTIRDSDLTLLADMFGVSRAVAFERLAPVAAVAE